MAKKASMNSYDLIIVGAGPAGLTAGIYAARAKLNTLILDKALPGGLVAYTYRIENYPGFEAITGKELAARMEAQARNCGAKLKTLEEVVRIEKLKDGFKVLTSKQSYFAKALIIASGTFHRSLNIPGEKELIGKGISFCATCDGPLYKGKNIAIIGCGNSGLQEGLYLASLAKSITFIEFLPFMTADRILQERVKKLKNANFLLNHEVVEIKGKQRVEAIKVRDRASGKTKELKVDGVFVYVGLLPNSAFLKGFLKLDEKGFVVTDERLATSVPGIWAAGDIRSGSVRQISAACGDGTIAALMARKWLEERSKR